MGARSKSRFTTAQAGWIALAVFAAWLVFLFVPTPRKPKPAASNELPPMAAQSKLEAVGLTNNPDWYGLPGYFAVWADSAGWLGDKAYFAYWNPGSHSYSYFFEAIREGSRIRFRSVRLDQIAGDGLPFERDELAEYDEARKPDSPTHPFVFWYPLKAASVLQQPSRISDPGEKPAERVEIMTSPQQLPLPAVKFPEPPNVEPSK